MRHQSMTLEEATYTLEEDMKWLVKAGFMRETSTTYEFLDDPYRWLMEGSLNLPPHHEIQILRRIERVTDLGVKIEQMKWNKRKFKS